MFENIYNDAFQNEIDKIAEQGSDPVALSKTFWAGFDPTGSATFKLSQNAQRHGKHQLSGVAGGLVGGAVVLPSAVSGFIGAAQGAKAARGGGWRGRLLGGLAGFAKGTVAPYKQIYHGVRASGALGKAVKTGKISAGGVAQVQKALGVKGGKLFQSAPVRSAAGFLKGSKTLGGLQNLVKGQTTGAMTAIGASAALGGGSSLLQYGQGRAIGVERRAGWQQKTAGDYVEIGKHEIASRSDINAGKYKQREPIIGRRRRARKRTETLNIIKTNLANKD